MGTHAPLQVVQGSALLKAMRSAGVGLLASSVTLAANFHFPAPVLGLEAPLKVSQVGSGSENYNWDAPSTSGDIPGNETLALGVMLPDECAEAAAMSLVPKEEPVQEVTNESVVQEAWQVVNESFLDARHNSWSADAWLVSSQCLRSVLHLPAGDV
jgi:hypothetical protein